MIRNIHIQNFRGFVDLKLENFGKVNLIVGSNSSGKTSLLEAVSVVSSFQTIQALPTTFRSNQGLRGGDILKWLIHDNGSEAKARIKSTDDGGDWEIQVAQKLDDLPGRNSPYKKKIQVDNGMAGIMLRDINKKVRAVSVQHKSPDQLVESFAEAVRPVDGEKLMERLLKTVDSRIRSARIDYEAHNRMSRIVLDMGLSERIPLSMSGQGVSRLISIFSELLGQKPEICLIDEIENGLHHLAHKQVWAGLAEVAEKLNIQIFATTHSGECLEAAHDAFTERETYDLRVVQLYPIENRTEGRVLDKDMIVTAINGNIDLR